MRRVPRTTQARHMSFQTVCTYPRAEEEKKLKKQQSRRSLSTTGKQGIPNRRDALRRRRIRFQNEHLVHQLHEPREARLLRCSDPGLSSRSTQSIGQSPLRRTWRQVANKSSKGTDDVRSETCPVSGSSCPESRCRRRRKNVRSAILINTQNNVYDVSSETAAQRTFTGVPRTGARSACWLMQQPWIRNLCRQRHA